LDVIQKILLEKKMVELAEYVRGLTGLDQRSVTVMFENVTDVTDSGNLNTAIEMLNKRMIHHRETTESIAALSQQQQFSVREQPPQSHSASASSASSASSSSPPPAPRSVPQTSTGIVVKVDGSKVDNPKSVSNMPLKYYVPGEHYNGPQWGIVKELTGISGHGITRDTYFVITKADDGLATADTLYEKVDTGKFKVAGDFDRTNNTINFYK